MVEIKSQEGIAPVHQKQVQTYLKAYWDEVRYSDQLQRGLD